MVNTSAYRMADRLAGDNLAGILRDLRIERKESLRRVATILYAEYGIEATYQTVANWCDELGIDIADRVAS